MHDVPCTNPRRDIKYKYHVGDDAYEYRAREGMRSEVKSTPDSERTFDIVHPVDHHLLRCVANMKDDISDNATIASGDATDGDSARREREHEQLIEKHADLTRKFEGLMDKHAQLLAVIQGLPHLLPDDTTLPQPAEGSPARTHRASLSSQSQFPVFYRTHWP